MKKVASIAILFFALASMLTACNTESGKKDSAPKKISVVATIYPQYDWLKNVIGERADAVDLKLLIKNGTDLHSYKPSAQDIATIAKADLVVYVGGESDEWIEKALEATPKEGRIALNLMKALGDRVKEEEVVEGMQVEEHHHEHGEEAEEHEHEHHEHAEKHEDEHHHHEEVENDEHIWLSLKNASILVSALAESLSKVDSANSSIYIANAATYNAKLQELDEKFTTAISGASQKTVLFGDRFPFRYLVDDYGIKYYAAFVGCSAESEASFETVTFLAGKMDSLQLPAIFTIDGSNGKIARAILEASKNSKNAQVLTLNSMQSVTDEQIKAGVDYLSIMRDNLEVLKKALK
ncbi:zinc transport system substrate-binding protein [Fibrobacter sp. UWT3]|uniref:metal ABC transporter substrate-binding protein n=1 Tax=Fibrobacter sp. UWT3 TaxID=1896225 RepID=UPI000BDD26C4|nr:metal ABC transporter substrate-binding protein [Fibrobacter sp. UWT3]SOE54897.1 zinc transport system substrate-binding protein [Fibrobacter sp. UWT3]